MHAVLEKYSRCSTVLVSLDASFTCTACLQDLDSQVCVFEKVENIKPLALISIHDLHVYILHVQMAAASCCKLVLKASEGFWRMAYLRSTRGHLNLQGLQGW